MKAKPLVRKHIKFSKGFTLVELLIVVIIIAVLAALGFPLVERVRASAKRTQCMTQLRNWAGAFGGYMADHDGKINWEHWPSIGNTLISSSPYQPYWTGDGDFKTGHQNQLIMRNCPTVKWDKTKGNSPVSYATIQPNGVAKVGVSGPEKGTSSDYSLSKVSRPSRFMLMIDAKTISGAGYSVSTAGDFTSKVKPLTEKGDESRHNQAVNALLADFSVKTMYWPEINAGLSGPSGTPYWTTF